jgi:hypothetical protein
MHHEMPGFFPGRPGGEHDEPLLDMILERRPIPPGAPPEIHGLARMLAAVAGSAEPGDLPGQAAALAAFTRVASPPGTSLAALRSARRSLSERPARGRLPLAVALAAAAAGLGSTAAAYAGVLPSPIQVFAHVALAAPEPPRDFILRSPAVTSSPAHGHPEPRPSVPAKGQSAAISDPVSDKTHPGPLRGHLAKGSGAAPGYYSCVPAQATAQSHGQAAGHSQNPAVPSPAPDQVTPGSTHGPGGSGPDQDQDTASPGFSFPGSLALPSPSTPCPDGTIATKAAHARGQ